jgi:quercetin dioxygenase-like cupin family protein
MSHPDPSLVDVRTLADHPLTESGRASVRMVVPGSATARRFGLVEYRLAPHSRGAEPHYHQTFSESFYVVDGSLTLYAGDRWQACAPGDFAIAHERGVHGFRNDGDEPATFLILFTPGIAREEFFAELLELARSGRKPTPEEMTAFYARHDQVMVEV